MGARAVIDPRFGCSVGKLNQTLRSALRQIWSRTVKKEYVKSVRYKKGKPPKFHVRCAICGLEMATADKKKPINKDGSVSKRKAQKLFDADHVDGIASLKDPIKDLGAYWESMMMGELRILCKPCHAKRTEEQRKEK